MSTRFVRPLLLILCSLLSVSAAAADPAFSLQLGRAEHVQSISSGSGMVPYGNGYLVVGDDTPYLFTVDRHFSLRDQTLLKPYPMSYRRIDKAIKPDYEAMARFVHRGDDWVLILGSGSKKNVRETGFLLSADQRVVIERSLAPLYQQLATSGGLRGKQTLNVEGLAVAGDQVFFLNRGNSGPNLIFRADLEEVVAYMRGEHEALSRIERYDVRLPVVQGFEATFSGADYWPQLDALVFSASVEATGDAYADGAVLGSYLGVVRLEQLRSGTINDLSDTLVRLRQKGRPLLTKVESVAITESDARQAKGALVSDNDDGSSVFFNFKLTLKR